MSEFTIDDLIAELMDDSRPQFSEAAQAFMRTSSGTIQQVAARMTEVREMERAEELARLTPEVMAAVRRNARKAADAQTRAASGEVLWGKDSY